MLDAIVITYCLMFKFMSDEYLNKSMNVKILMFLWISLWLLFEKMKIGNLIFKNMILGGCGNARPFQKYFESFNLSYFWSHSCSRPIDAIASHVVIPFDLSLSRFAPIRNYACNHSLCLPDLSFDLCDCSLPPEILVVLATPDCFTSVNLNS